LKGILRGFLQQSSQQRTNGVRTSSFFFLLLQSPFFSSSSSSSSKKLSFQSCAEELGGTVKTTAQGADFLFADDLTAADVKKYVDMTKNRGMK